MRPSSRKPTLAAVSFCHPSAVFSCCCCRSRCLASSPYFTGKRFAFVLLACASLVLVNFLIGTNEYSLRKFPELVSDTVEAFSWNVHAVRAYSLEEIQQILNLTKDVVDVVAEGGRDGEKSRRKDDWSEILSETSSSAGRAPQNFSAFFGADAKCPPVPPNLSELTFLVRLHLRL
jgi:hypothetical protein